MSQAILSSEVGTSYKERCGQSICHCGRCRDNGCAQDLLGWLSGSGVDDVAVAYTVMLKELLLASAGRHCAVLDSQDCQSLSLTRRVPHADRPTVAMIPSSDRTHTARASTK